MILRFSEKLASRLGCGFSKTATPIAHSNELVSWSGDLLTHEAGGELAILRNDASYSTLIVPLAKVKTFDRFLPIFFLRVATLWKICGGHFDPLNQGVIVLKRSNRSLIISMNQTMRKLPRIITDFTEDTAKPDWQTIEYEINEYPSDSLKYMMPTLELQMRLLELP